MTIISDKGRFEEYTKKNVNEYRESISVRTDVKVYENYDVFAYERIENENNALNGFVDPCRANDPRIGDKKFMRNSPIVLETLRATCSGEIIKGNESIATLFQKMKMIISTTSRLRGIEISLEKFQRRHALIIYRNTYVGQTFSIPSSFQWRNNIIPSVGSP